MKHKIRILIAEDHFVARAGLIATINTQPDMIVVAEAEDGVEAVELFDRHKPDLGLLDMRMPRMSGAEAATAIRARHAQARLIVLTTFGGSEDIRRAFVAGVRGFLTKEVHRDELLRAIRTVLRGESYLPAGISHSLEAHQNSEPLSARELEVLRLIVAGLGNKQIAYSLDIAEPTAKSHVKSILFKLGVADRTQATTEAIRRGIVYL
jgi:two-component system NarL family response regulator